MDIKTLGAIQVPQNTYQPPPAAGKEAPTQDLPKPAGIAAKQAAVAAEEAAKAREASERDIRAAIEKIEKFIEPATRDITFSIDRDTGINLIRIVDRTSNEVIRQIPGDEVLSIARALDNLQGLLVKEKI